MDPFPFLRKLGLPLTETTLKDSLTNRFSLNASSYSQGQSPTARQFSRGSGRVDEDEEEEEEDLELMQQQAQEVEQALTKAYVTGQSEEIEKALVAAREFSTRASSKQQDDVEPSTPDGIETKTQARTPLFNCPLT